MLTPQKNINLQWYIDQDCFIIPQETFVYDPRKANPFAKQGEVMVENLLKVAPVFHDYFNNVFPIKLQRDIAQQEFEAIKIKKSQEKIYSSISSKGKTYFETNRVFEFLVPPCYKRSEVPRLTAVGTSFHGMKKELLKAILKVLESSYPVQFYEIDISACHARIAASFQKEEEESFLKKSLKEDSFWDQQVNSNISLFLKDISEFEGDPILVDKLKPFFKKILKVGIYTALNGGLSYSERNVFNNIDASDILKHNTFLEPHLDLFGRNIIDVFKQNPLSQELEKINLKCFIPEEYSEKLFKSHGIDRVLPYYMIKKHLSISRCLQSFEIVLLTILVKEVLVLQALPVSLDHDGLLVMLPSKIDSEAFLFELNHNFHPWAYYLLKGPAPLVIK